MLSSVTSIKIDQTRLCVTEAAYFRSSQSATDTRIIMAFPLTTGCEGIAYSLLRAMNTSSYFVPLPSIVMGGGSVVERYVDGVVRSLEFTTTQSEAVGIRVEIDATYVPSIDDEKPLDVSYLPPARVFTWNDAFVNVSNGDETVIESKYVRKVVVKLEDKDGELKSSGSITVLGKLEFDRQREFKIVTGVKLRTQLTEMAQYSRGFEIGTKASGLSQYGSFAHEPLETTYSWHSL